MMVMKDRTFNGVCVTLKFGLSTYTYTPGNYTLGLSYTMLTICYIKNTAVDLTLSRGIRHSSFSFSVRTF
jgi:hypothetical protein